MKRRLTQKVKNVPLCAADSSDALSKLSVGKHPVGTNGTTELDRRARTSAAMIGLAISMGASGLLLPQQGDEAIAVEPEAAAASRPSMPVKPGTASNSQTISLPPAEHQVQKGQTLRELSQTYQVKPQQIAASNNIKPNAILPIGEKLKIPSVNGEVGREKAGETVEKLSKSYGVEPTQRLSSASVSEDQSKTSVNELLKARQELALDRLKTERDRLNISLAELRSEESANLSELAKVPSSLSKDNEPTTSVSLPPAVLKPEKSVAKVSQPVVSVPTSPVIIPDWSPAQSSLSAVESAETKGTESVVIPVPSPETAASLAVEPRATTPDNLASGEVTTGNSVPQLQAPLSVDRETVLVARPADVYRVQPGDTIFDIARRHGLSDLELIQLNRLNNPNLISINQELRIPQISEVPVIPSIKTQAWVSQQQDPGVAVPTLASNTLPNRIRTVASTEQFHNSQVALRPVVAQSTIVANGQPNSTLLADNRPNQSTESENNAYIEQLRSDILKLRKEYPQVSQTNQDNEPRNIEVSTEVTPAVEQLRSDILKLRKEYPQGGETAQTVTPRTIEVPTRETPVVDSRNNRLSTSERFSSNSKLEQPTQPTSIPIAVPKAAAIPEQESSASIEIEVPSASVTIEEEKPQPRQLVQQGPITIPVPKPERQTLAAVPAPTSSYNPIINTPVGEMVSPQLPPLSPPDMYLPDSPAPFNGYIWPSKGVITSGYGRRWGRMHRGIDIAAPIGTPVVAAAPGVVVSAGWNSGGYGKLVEIQHPDGSLTLYAHNNRILVRRGQEVAQGEQISEMGSTGRSTGPHLHFEVHPSGRGAVNPMAYLPRR